MITARKLNPVAPSATARNRPSPARGARSPKPIVKKVSPLRYSVGPSPGCGSGPPRGVPLPQYRRPNPTTSPEAQQHEQGKRPKRAQESLALSRPFATARAGQEPGHPNPDPPAVEHDHPR